MNELNFMHENISGIYNYCDRWCEKCKYTNRCLLFKQEAEREIKHILKDEDNPDVWVKDAADDFQEASEQVNKFMDEEDEEYEEFGKDDFDFDDENDDDFERNFLKEEIADDARPSTFLKSADNPLILLSENLFKDFYNYYDRLKLKFPDELEEKNPQSPLQQNLDILGWYTPQIHVKIRMSYWNKHKFLKSKDPEIAEIDKDIFNVSARIAFIGIENCMTALQFLYQQKPEFQSETKFILNTVLQIKNIFIEEFPAAQTYKRPYFD
ncbi:MAG: hypothetical protein IPH11_08745 [Ignavibacteriales bacterium]|nr:hypothetical protein [Ignavibacteriales bacterium]